MSNPLRPRPNPLQSYPPPSQNPQLNSRQLQYLTTLQTRLSILYATPATQQQATLHRKATTFGYTPQHSTRYHVPVCACCLLPITTQELSLNTATTPSVEDYILLQSFYLQTHISLFFTFIKFGIIYLLVLLLTVSIFALSMSLLNTHFCQHHLYLCGNSAFIQYSPAKQANKGHLYLVITDLLNLIMVAMSLLFFRHVRKLWRDIDHALKYHNESQEDYSVMVRGVPALLEDQEHRLVFRYEERIKEFMERKVVEGVARKEQEKKEEEREEKKEEEKEGEEKVQNNGDGVDGQVVQQVYAQDSANGNNSHALGDIVTSITLCYDLKQLAKIQQYRKQLVQAAEKQLQARDSSRDTRLMRELSYHLSQKFTAINQQYLQTILTFNTQRHTNWTLTHFLGTALVSFQHQKYRNYIYELYTKSPSEFVLDGRQLEVSCGPRPENVEWHNMGLSWGKKVRQSVISFLVIAAALTVSYVTAIVIDLIEFPPNVLTPSNKKGPSFWDMLIIPVWTYTGNYLLRKLCKYLNDKEKHETTTGRQEALLGKYIIATVLNTLLLFFMLSVLQGERFLLDNGLVVLTSYFLAPLGILSILVNSLALDQMVESIPQTRPSPSETIQLHYSLDQQASSFDLSERYSYYLSTLYLTVFYSYINPLLVAVAVLLFFLHYWIDKYTLFRRSARLPFLSHQYSQTTLRLFQLTLLFFSLGNFYFSFRITNKISEVNTVALLIALSYTILTLLYPSQLQRIFCSLRRTYQPDSYSQCIAQGKFGFGRNYWSCNPATMLTEEMDLNKKGEVLQYGGVLRLADWRDLVRTPGVGREEYVRGREEGGEGIKRSGGGIERERYGRNQNYSNRNGNGNRNGDNRDRANTNREGVGNSSRYGANTSSIYRQVPSKQPRTRRR